MPKVFIKLLDRKNLRSYCGAFALTLPLGFTSALQAESKSETQETTDIAITAKQAQLLEIEQFAAASVPDQIAPTAPVPPPPLIIAPEQVKVEKRVSQGGRTITYQRLSGPPQRLLPPTPVASANLSESTTEEATEPRKPHVNLSLSSTVYDREITEMRWFHEGREYKVFINFDFTLFRSVGRVEGQDKLYSLNLGVGESTREEEKQLEEHLEKKGISLDEAQKLPSPALFATNTIMVLPASGNPSDLVETPEYQALPDLIRFYIANHNDLLWQQAIQKAENAARKRWRDAQPPAQPKNVTIPFWPVKSRLYPVEPK